MTTTKGNLFLRQDTLFGACQGLADDFGISALWLRIPLAATILYSPEIAFGTYAFLCALVLVTRKVWPVKSVAVETPATAVEAAPVLSADNEQRELAQAA
ncbi:MULTISPECIES: PspC domain-containing protein [Sphingomonas]|uniref:PspC domain-containing protein n=1 Tax=Sphingomonas TaxID=13687 RepID=UPI000DEF75D2|nr:MULTISPECIES: PspC domain-containing protein [Sphingomonas]